MSENKTSALARSILAIPRGKTYAGPTGFEQAALCEKLVRMEKTLRLISRAPRGDMSGFYLDEAAEALSFDPLADA